MSRFFLLMLLTSSALACDYPDEGNRPLRRAVALVRDMPEVAAWAERMHDAGELVQYVVLLEQPVRLNGACYWTVETRAKGATWRRFYVTPDGKRVVPADPR